MGDPDMDTANHPAVLQATAARDKAAFDLAQTVVRAPADGIVSQASSFKAGQYVTAGTPLFSLVETGDTWVEANFKETQLTHMKLGQSAEIVLDTYPGKPLRATVESIGAGTGADGGATAAFVPPLYPCSKTSFQVSSTARRSCRYC